MDLGKALFLLGATLLSWFVIALVGILTMIYGWGLEPQSWGWIIGGQIFAVTVGAGIQTFAKMIARD